MKKIAYLFILIVLGACEVYDVEVIDLNQSIPTEENPFDPGDLNIRFVVQLSNGSIVYNDGNKAIYLRKINGTTITTSYNKTIHRIGSYGTSVALHVDNGDVRILDENLEFVDYYTAGSDIFITGFGKVTFGSGLYYQLYAGQKYTASALPPISGYPVVFNSNSYPLVLPNNTYSIGEQYDISSRSNNYILIKYDNQLNIISSQVLEQRLYEFFSNSSKFYLSELPVNGVNRLHEYNASGVFQKTIDATLPNSSRKLLDNGDLLILDLSSKSFYIRGIETNERLWTYSYPTNGVLLAHNMSLDGKIWIVFRYSGLGTRIFQIKAEY